MKLFRTASLLIALAGLISNVAAQQKNTMEKSLSSRETQLVGIAAYTAKGDLLKLKRELNTSLNAGLTISEIKEAIVQLYAYCGFPRSIRGLQTLMVVLDERKATGISDKPGPEASPVKDQRDKYDRGKEILEKLTGTPQNGPRAGYAAFAPEIEIFLKEHLFADIFERDVLSYSDRELVTISVLSSIGGVEPMLSSHFNICLHIGLTPGQLQEFVHLIKSNLGVKEAKSAQNVLDQVLQSNGIKVRFPNNLTKKIKI